MRQDEGARNIVDVVVKGAKVVAEVVEHVVDEGETVVAAVDDGEVRPTAGV